MAARSVVAGVIGVLIIIALVVAAVLGFGLLQQPSPPSSNPTSNVTNTTISMTTAIVTPSSAPTTIPATPTPAGQQIVVTRGQTFTINLSANPSTGYEWRPTFDTGTLSLRNETFVRTPTSTLLVGVGGTDLFTFQALREGTTSITFDYVSPGGQTTQSASYTVVIR